jgi:hypothetical protein
MESQDTRRRFLARVLGGSAALVLVGGAGAGCGASAQMVGQGGEGPVEFVPQRDGLFYFNKLPTSIPAVRWSPAVAPDWSTSKASE